MIPLSKTEVLYQNLGAAVRELVVVPGADHNDIMFTGEKGYFESLSALVGAKREKT